MAHGVQRVEAKGQFALGPRYEESLKSMIEIKSEYLYVRGDLKISL